MLQNQEQNINQTSDTKKITYCMTHQNKEGVLARDDFLKGFLVVRHKRN